MQICFENITERDMDLLFMRKFSYDREFLNLFLKEVDLCNGNVSVDKISHSVTTEDGESDIEVVLNVEPNKKIALLIEDKIDAPAMENQSERYRVRGEKAVARGDYDAFHVFIIAPAKYLEGNQEAKKYPNKITYESISLNDPFEVSVMEEALEVSKHGYVTIYNKQVTDFWDQVYDFAEERYPGVFRIHGQKGLARSGTPGQWITIGCNNRFTLNIKSNRGYVDLEIGGYADKFELFSKKNKDLIDQKRLYVRTASKSLAIRQYVPMIDFSQPFETQKEALIEAFDAAKELQDLIKDLKI